MCDFILVHCPFIQSVMYTVHPAQLIKTSVLGFHKRQGEIYWVAQICWVAISSASWLSHDTCSRVQLILPVYIFSSLILTSFHLLNLENVYPIETKCPVLHCIPQSFDPVTCNSVVLVKNNNIMFMYEKTLWNIMKKHTWPEVSM